MSSQENDEPPFHFEGGYVTQTGFVRRDPFGRVYIDRCKTEEEHITRPPPPGRERRDVCRLYLDDLIPAQLEGKEVTVEIDIRITNC